jgi:autotransporter-associated beta strand protein
MKKFLHTGFLLLLASPFAMAQVTLTGTNYLENFNSLGSGLPTGWTTRLGVSSNSIGTALAFTNTSAAATINGWANTTAAFKNFASTTGLASNSTTAQQTNSTNRALGIRPTGTFGDVSTNYAGFVLQLSNTAGFGNFSLTMDAMVFSADTRTNIWTLDYGIGSSPTSFTSLTNWTTPASWGSTSLSISSATLAGIANLSDNVWLRFSILTPGTGSGSRDPVGIDNFSLTYTALAGTEYFWAADGSTLGGAGTWNTVNTTWSAATNPVTGVAWDSSKTATFGGSSGAAITVDTVTADKGLQFVTDGYVLSSGIVTLGGATSADNTLSTSAGVTATIDSTLAGSAAIAKAGVGTLVLGGSNSFSGTLSVDSGALRATQAAALGASASGTTVASGAALELSGGITIADEALGLSGAGISSGGALRSVSGDNTYAGAITLNAASRINSAAGTLTLDVTSGNAVTGTQNLTFGGAGNVVVNDAISTGTGTLTKDGAGSLSLNAANTYTGSTTVSAGTLKLGASGSIASTSVTVATGAIFDLTEKASGYTLSNGTTLGGSGTVSLAVGQSLSVGTGSVIQAGSATSNGTLTLSGLVFDGGGSYNFSIGNVVGAAGTNWDLLTASQAFAISATSGSKFTINVAGNSGNPTGFANTGNYSWNILTLSAGSISGFDASAFTLNNGFTGSDGTLTLTSDGTKLTLNYLAGTPATIAWANNNSAWLTAGNWTGGAIPGPGDVAQFGASPTGTTVGINMGSNGGNQSVGAIEVTSARATALSITNSSGTAPGVLTLAGVTINGTPNVILRNNSGQSLTLANGATQTMGVALGNATDNVVVIDSTGGITISSVISGAGKSLTLTGAGTGILTLSGANTYTGPTSILDGQLILSLSGSLTSDVTVGALGAIGGRGAITGDLFLSSGADFVFDINGPLLVNSGNVSFGGLSITDIAGLTSTTAEGVYTLIGGSATFDFANVSNFGSSNAVSLGDGKFAYFSEGSLQVNVVPEPSTYALLALAGAGFAGYVIRRRRR